MMASALGLALRGSALRCLCLVCQSGAAQARTEAAAAVTILTLDQDRLFTANSLFGKALETRALAATQALAAENRKIEADLDAEEQALTDQRATLSPEDFRPLAEASTPRSNGSAREQDAKASDLADTRDAGRKQFLQPPCRSWPS